MTNSQPITTLPTATAGSTPNPTLNGFAGSVPAFFLQLLAQMTAGAATQVQPDGQPILLNPVAPQPGTNGQIPTQQPQQNKPCSMDQKQQNGVENGAEQNPVQMALLQTVMAGVMPIPNAPPGPITESPPEPPSIGLDPDGASKAAIETTVVPIQTVPGLQPALRTANTDTVIQVDALPMTAGEPKSQAPVPTTIPLTIPPPVPSAVTSLAPSPTPLTTPSPIPTAIPGAPPVRSVAQEVKPDITPLRPEPDGKPEANLDTKQAPSTQKGLPTLGISTSVPIQDVAESKRTEPDPAAGSDTQAPKASARPAMHERTEIEQEIVVRGVNDDTATTQPRAEVAHPAEKSTVQVALQSGAASVAQPTLSEQPLPLSAMPDTNADAQPIPEARGTVTTPRLVPADLAAAMLPIQPADSIRTIERSTPLNTGESSGDLVVPITSAKSESAGERDTAQSESRDSSNGDRSSGFTPPVVPRETVTYAVKTEASSIPQDRVQVVQQVAHKLETMRLVNGRQEVTLHLQPAHLGDVQLTIVADRSNVSARMVVESSFVRHAMEEGKQQLHAALEQKGYSLQGLDVALNQSGTERRFMQLPSNDTNAPMRAYRSVAPVDGIQVESTPTARDAAAYLNGHLDYQA